MDGKALFDGSSRAGSGGGFCERGCRGHESAARFGVAPSTVINWVRRFRETGSVAPGQMGGRKPKAIAGEYAAFLARRVRDGAFTLRGLMAELAERGLKVDYRSVWNFVHAEKLSFKKKPWSPSSAIGLMSRAGAPSGRSARAGSTPSAWCSSTRRGRRPTWSRCAAGRRVAKDWWRKSPHGHWKTMTFVSLFFTTASRRRGSSTVRSTAKAVEPTSRKRWSTRSSRLAL